MHTLRIASSPILQQLLDTFKRLGLRAAGVVQRCHLLCDKLRTELVVNYVLNYMLRAAGAVI